MFTKTEVLRYGWLTLQTEDNKAIHVRLVDIKTVAESTNPDNSEILIEGKIFVVKIAHDELLSQIRMYL